MKAKNRAELVQLKNPKSGQYILIDRIKGQIIRTSTDGKPFKGVVLE